ncbi:MAG: DUF2997 domain-containing protein [Planctomycetales bacterium]|nr:DUF2997 domain-containing protein [Planctomycetales bacterium]
MINTSHKIIEVVVSPTGQTRLRTQGFSGAECQAASQFLEATLGQRSASRQTPEFFLPPTTEQTPVRNGE